MQINMQGLLDIFNMYGGFQPIRSQTIKLDEPILTNEQFQSLSEPLKRIYQSIFRNEQKNFAISQFLPMKPIKTETPICNKILDEHEPVFRCLECSTHPSAVFCIKCFENGEHSDHRYIKFPAGGGNCDCGNPVAIKPEGFCKNHTGKPVNQMKIPQKQQQIFLECMMNLIAWFGVLMTRGKKKQTNIMGQIVFKYLSDLNQSSIYYNILTSKLLHKNIKNLQNLKLPDNHEQFLIIDFLFYLKRQNHVHSIKTINKMYFNMFALEDFKLELSKSFVKAYNTIKDFQNTDFHSLFIQLFANTNIVVQLIKQNILLDPTKKSFKLIRFLNDIHFITTIDKQTSIMYLQKYLQDRVLPLAFLRQIQKKIEQKQDGSQSLHMVDMVINYLDEENMFLITMQEIITIFKQNNRKDLIINILSNTYKCLTSNKYSYKKNKAILPYHRLFTAALFAYLQGNIHSLLQTKTVEQICSDLNITREEWISSMKYFLKTILICLKQFSQTYAKRNYFQNYFPLYIRKGKKLINFDYMLAKMCFMNLKDDPQDFYAILTAQKSQSTSTQQLHETFHKQIVYLGVLTQTIISKTPQIIQNSKMCLQNTDVLSQKRLLFKRLLKTSGPITKQQILPLQMHFLGVLQDQQLSATTIFNKTTRKYSPIQSDKVQSLDISYYPSRSKVDLNLNRNPLSKQNQPPIISKNELELVCLVINKPLLQMLAKNITKKDVFQYKNQEMLCDLFKQFIQRYIRLISKNIDQTQECLFQLGTLKDLQQICQEITNFIKYLKKDENNMMNKEQSNEQTQKKILMERAKAKKQRLKQKFQGKAKKILNGNQNVIKEGEKQFKEIIQLNQEEKICMICKDPSEQDSIFYIANLQTVNMLNQKIGIQQNLLYFRSCLHSAHYKCYSKLYGNRPSFKCPLCKAQSNIMLPVPNLSDDSSHDQMMSRMDVIAGTQSLTQQFLASTFPKVNNCNMFWNLLKSYSEIVGLNGLMDPQGFKRNKKNLANCLFKINQRFWEKKLNLQNQNLFHEIIAQYKKIHQEQQKKRPELIPIFEIKLCCIDVFFQSLLHPISTQYIVNRYSFTINHKDLEQLIVNILLTINPDTTPEVQSLQEIKPIKSVKDILLTNYFKPPESAQKLFQLKTQTSKLCKNGHNILVCIICSEKFCYDCQKAKDHAKKIHSNHCVFISLFQGGIVYYNGSRKIKSKSIYENNVGAYWTMDKQPTNFNLNAQVYQSLLREFYGLNLEEYLKRVMKNSLAIMQQNTTIFAQFMMEELNEAE